MVAFEYIEEKGERRGAKVFSKFWCLADIPMTFPSTSSVLCLTSIKQCWHASTADEHVDIVSMLAFNLPH